MAFHGFDQSPIYFSLKLGNIQTYCLALVIFQNLVIPNIRNTLGFGLFVS